MADKLMTDGLLIGSRAIDCYFPKFRQLDDFDIILPYETFIKWRSENNAEVIKKDGRKAVCKYGCDVVEFEFSEIESCSQLLNYQIQQPRVVDYFGLKLTVATPEMSFIIKKSHVNHPDNWFKNIKDYHFLKKHIGSTIGICQKLQDIGEVRRGEKNTRTYRTLAVDNSQFFIDSQRVVKRIYNHDDLHYATCYYDEPLWVKCKKDTSKAFVSQSMFKELSHLEQIQMVREEGFVIALERKLIKIPGTISPSPSEVRSAFKHAIMRVCTTLTSGWFRDFAVENYFEIVKLDCDYSIKYNLALESNLIRSFSNDN